VPARQRLPPVPAEAADGSSARSRTARASKCAALCSRLATEAKGASGPNRSMICSRCMRWVGANASTSTS
jgi:hypothetical protein